jgi:MFS family permease
MKTLKHIIIILLLLVYTFFGSGISIGLLVDNSNRSLDLDYIEFVFIILFSLIAILGVICCIIYVNYLIKRSKKSPKNLQIDQVAFPMDKKTILFKRIEIILYSAFTSVLFLFLCLFLFSMFRNYLYYETEISMLMIFVQIFVLLSVILFFIDVRAFNKKRLQDEKISDSTTQD